MTADKLENAVNSLVELVKIDNFSDVKAIDNRLAEVMSFNNPLVIRPLIRLFNDNPHYDEAIFSIIHGIESFEEDVYISEFLKELPYFIHKSPRWASILLIRILNCNSSRENITKKLYFAPPEIKESMIWLVEKINQVSPIFLEKTVAVLVASKSI